MKIIAINRSDGGVSIMKILDDLLSIKSEIDKWEQSMNGITSVSYQEITEADIPTDRANRDAWIWQ